MQLIDQFERPEPTPEDAFTFVFDTQQDGQNDMLMMGVDGFRHGYWTTGRYDPDGENTHLGQRVKLHELGNAVLNAFFYRLSIPKGTEDYYAMLDDLADDIEDDIEAEDDGNPLQGTR